MRRSYNPVCLEHSASPLLVLKAPSSTSYFDSQSYVDREDALYNHPVYLRAWIFLWMLALWAHQQPSLLCAPEGREGELRTAWYIPEKPSVFPSGGSDIISGPQLASQLAATLKAVTHWAGLYPCFTQVPNLLSLAPGPPVSQRPSIGKADILWTGPAMACQCKHRSGNCLERPLFVSLNKAVWADTAVETCWWFLRTKDWSSYFTKSS